MTFERSPAGKTPPVVHADIDFPKTIDFRKDAGDKTDDQKQQSRSLWIQGWTLAAVAVYATIAIFQWCAMRESNRQAAKQLELSERAWVGVSNIVILSNNSDWTNIRVQVHIKNAGRSPARKVTIFAGGKILAKELVSDEDFAEVTPLANPDVAMGRAPLLPDDVAETPVFEITLNPGDINDTRSLFIAGIVGYVDIFGN